MKYIIDIPDDTTCINALKYEDRKCVAARSYIIPDLTPYTEPDIGDVEDEVWSFAWKIFSMDIREYAEIFDDKGCSSDYREAKAKFEAWLKQKDEIHVGDEVAFEMAFGNGLDNNMKAVALDQATKGEEWCVLTENGCVETHDEEDLYKTGRHFDEVEELLKKMRGEQDE